MKQVWSALQIIIALSLAILFGIAIVGGFKH